MSVPRSISCPNCTERIELAATLADGSYRCGSCGFSLTPLGTSNEGHEAHDAIPEEWEVLRELGRGGMGVVYQARHRLTSEYVALKSITAAASRDMAYLERFAEEVRILHGLVHARVVRLLHSGINRGQPWLAMELIDGAPLRSLLVGKPFSREQVLLIGRQIAEALSYTHQRGVVHRDLKPENVLIARTLNVKVVDFGLAKALIGNPDRPQLTAPAARLGTFHYMAPEQERGAGDVSPAADMYSLGVVLFEMLTGTHPHGAERPRDLRPETPQLLSDVTCSLLARGPERRPSSQEVLTAFIQMQEEFRGDVLSEVEGSQATYRSPYFQLARSSIADWGFRRQVAGRVLWVDDLPENNGFEECCLNTLGVKVVWAVSTEAAMLRFQSEHFDLVITDMSRPPEQDAGFRLLQALVDAKAQVAVVFYCSVRSADFRLEARRRGAYGVSNEPNGLLRLVCDALEEATLSKGLQSDQS